MDKKILGSLRQDNFLLANPKKEKLTGQLVGQETPHGRPYVSVQIGRPIDWSKRLTKSTWTDEEDLS